MDAKYAILYSSGEDRNLTLPQTKPDEEPNESQTPVAAAINLTYTTSSASDDYYQTVVINALLGILKDQSLNNQHHTVIEAIMSIFKTQGLKCVTFLPQVREHSRQYRCQLDSRFT
jgi:phosphatidylinositol kinase/protein kinase (PI-3  family)